MTNSDLSQIFARLSYILINGCGNHGCQIKKPTGQGTNGPCNCGRREIKQELKWIIRELEVDQEKLAMEKVQIIPGLRQTGKYI